MIKLRYAMVKYGFDKYHLTLATQTVLYFYEMFLL